MSIVYGPVSSRRLGYSLGINNIPPKYCSYACVYCQLGRTTREIIERASYYEPDEIAGLVKAKLKQVEDTNEKVNFLTFVPDGEPTLDAGLGQEIGLVRTAGKKVAVITNASLLWREDVKRDLQETDWVSLKVDAASENAWRRIDRPHGLLQLGLILRGILDFRRVYKGELTTETMLVRGINDNPDELNRISDFLALVKPDTAYIAAPTRPPAERFVESASEQSINAAYHIFSERLNRVEYLTGYEGNAFSSTGDIREDILSITAVHPMREDAVGLILKRAGAGWQIVQELVDKGSLIALEYRGARFYVRKLPGWRNPD